jgi:hypothetical protein
LYIDSELRIVILSIENATIATTTLDLFGVKSPTIGHYNWGSRTGQRAIT